MVRKIKVNTKLEPLKRCVEVKEKRYRGMVNLDADTYARITKLAEGMECNRVEVVKALTRFYETSVKTDVLA